MSSPKTIKEVQSLTGRVAALNKFVSKATYKCLPFFKTLKRAFIWTDECETAFQELKRQPPTLESVQGRRILILILGSIFHDS